MITTGEIDTENVVMGYVVVDTPLQHWDYWDSDFIKVVGKEEKFFSRICTKAHGLLRYTKCFICRCTEHRTC